MSQSEQTSKIDEKYVLNALSRTNLYIFVKRAFYATHGYPLHDSFAIKLICDRLEKCMNGEINKLVINIPPRNLKSFIVSVCLPAFLLGKDPTKKIICISYSSDLANKFSRNTRDLMEKDFYQEIFPTKIGNKNTEDMFETTKHGSRTATTVKGSLTGFGGDYLILDDPCSADDAFSPVKRKNLEEWFQNTFLSRLDDKRKGVMILVMQRLHSEDLTSFMQRQGNWEILSLPAIAEQDETFTLSDNITVGRKAGKALNPAHEPLDVLLDLKQSMSNHNFSAQYQQNPIPEKGNIIDFKDFSFYNNSINLSSATTFQSWDIALKDGENNDYSVCITAKLHNNCLYVEDIARYKLATPDLIMKIIEMKNRYNASQVIIEESSMSMGIIDILKQTQSNISVLPHKPQGDKVVRANNAHFYIKSGNVKLLKDAQWIDDFLSEINAFPKGKHDDQVDALSQIINEVFKIEHSYMNLWIEAFKPKEKKTILQETPLKFCEEAHKTFIKKYGRNWHKRIGRGAL